MALIFSDQQIKNISKDALDLPLIINNPSDGTGLIQQKQKMVDAKANALIVDNQNKVYSDNWITTLQAYHDELKYLNLALRTTYSDSDLVNGGKQIAPHYDSNTWIKLVPKLLASNNGNSVGAYGGPKEQDKIDDANFYYNKLLNGFSFGSLDTTLSANYTIGSGTVQLTTGTLNANDWFIIDSAGNSTLFVVSGAGGFCTGETTPPKLTESSCVLDGGTWTATYTVTALSTDKNFSAGARVRVFHAGFNNSERGRVTTNYAFDVQTYFESNLDTKEASYKSHLIAQKAFVDANGDTVSGRKSLNDTEKTNLLNVITDFTTWESETVNSSTGKYTDSKITLVSNNLTTRTARIPNRITEITTNLGSISQDGDGVVTGTGAYLSLWELLLIRIGRAGGTLTSYYNADIGILVFDNKIANANSTLAQYLDTFVIAVVSSNTVIGQDVDVVSTTGLSIGNSVKVMDNDSIVYSRTISNIVGNTLTLNSSIPISLLASKQARVVRQK